MRISDWISDVCSSDLRALEQRHRGTEQIIVPGGERFTRPLLQALAPVACRCCTGRSDHCSHFDGRCARDGHRRRRYCGAIQRDLLGQLWRQILRMHVLPRRHDRQPATNILELANIAWPGEPRSEEHTSELQSLMRISYAGFCLK